MNIHTPRKLVSIVLAVCVLSPAAMAAPGSAAQDVPASHWAKKSVDSVTSKGLMSAKNGAFDGNKPVTRYELAVTLDRLVTYIEAGRKPLNPAPRPRAMKIPANTTPAERAAIKHLASDGFLPPTSPIFAGKGTEVVTAKQLSTALSQVTIRLSDRRLAPDKD